jgi:carbonic anhydrase
MRKIPTMTLAGVLLSCVLIPGAAIRAADHPAAEGVSAGEAFQRLERGNDRYTHDHLQAKNFAQERHALAKSQHPYAIIIACADSRVAPEIMFDESLGKLFVIRVAGNVIDPVVLGSVEYAADHLHSHLVVVLGHEGCGAVAAAIEGGTPPPNIAELTKRIAPAVEKTKGQGADAAVSENVRLQITRALSGSKDLTEMTAKKEIQIVGAVYHLESGKVEWLDRAAGAK